MIKKALFLSILIASAILLSSCGNSPQKTTSKTDLTSKNFQDKLIEANKMYVKKESDEIDQYIMHRGWKMTTTGTGLRYMITKKGVGEAAKPEQRAKVNFKVMLMDGTLCYSSDSTGAKEFTIGHDNIESGLHEGIQYLHAGDNAILILPSHLAFGLMGDGRKVPAKASVIYELEVISLK